MRFAWMWLLAACSFEHGLPFSGGSADVDAAIDGASIVIDAPVDARPDAGTVTCPDDDGDGVCNNVDDWPCGPKPANPPSTMTMMGNTNKTSVAISAVNLNQTNRLAVATVMQDLTIEFDYDITDTACPQNCVDQIEIGWNPGIRAMCPFDDNVSKMNGASGSISTTLTAPPAKGVYDLRANIGQNFSCYANGQNGWWGATPGATRTIAKLCVH